MSVPATADINDDLRAALERRDPYAADELVAQFGDRAYRLALRITGNAEDAEEAVQDALLSVVRKIDTFRGASALRSWIYRIVANAAYQKIRGRREVCITVPLDDISLLVDDGSASAVDWSARVDDPALQDELRRVLEAALSALPPDYRGTVVLRDVEGLSNREIGEQLGITVANVKTRVHRARLYLRKRLGQFMVADATVKEV
jgi:RNA polymerase sigma-70 factor, ECF subfamily